MAQDAVRRRYVVKAGFVAAGIAATIIQGLIVFFWQAFPGSFLSLTGFKCVVVPLFVEAIAGVIALKSYDDLHTHSVANPHSLIGDALRKGAPKAPAPPPVRDAWSGGFEDMDSAADKLSKGR